MPPPDRFTLNILQQHQRHLEGMTDAVDDMSAQQALIGKQNEQIIRLLSTTTTDRLTGFLSGLSVSVQLALIVSVTVLLVALLFLGAILYSGESPVTFALRFVDRSGDAVEGVFGGAECPPSSGAGAAAHPPELAPAPAPVHDATSAPAPDPEAP